MDRSNKKRSTGLCVVKLNGLATSVGFKCVKARETTDALVDLIGADAPEPVAIDGPLLPDYSPCDRYRFCESILSRGQFQKRCKPGPTNSVRGQLLHQQATKIALEVSRLFPEVTIAEAFPNAFLGVMLPDATYGVSRGNQRKSDYFYEQALHHRLIHGLCDFIFGSLGRKVASAAERVTNHDERAAFVCALTAASFNHRDGVKVGRQEDGWIWLPPKRFIQPWAMACLKSQKVGLSTNQFPGI